ncbi:MAG: hypothetical protein E4H36_07595 [Spirochaetales bacterium]|nr:MAG: hypothetical protein E4H36_07595 [Spirochaetales bacterium]
MNVIQLLAIPSVLRGFLVLLAAGTLFPLVGIAVLRFNLLNMRFMVMHGGLLGGAAALALGTNPLLLSLGINGLFLFGITRARQEKILKPSYVTTFLMVLSIGLAFLIMYKTGIQAKDSLSFLWGNILALTSTDIIITAAFSFGLLLFFIVYRRRLAALLFDADIAFTIGVNRGALNTAVIFIAGICITVSMRLIGALLLDALVLLPAIIGITSAGSGRGMFITSCVSGFLSVLLGFFASLILDIPVSTAVILAASLIFIFTYVSRRKRKA